MKRPGGVHTTMEFDRTRLDMRPLAERNHDLTLDVILPLQRPESILPDFITVAKRVVAARAAHAPVILMMGGHVIRAGVQKFLIDLMERGFISCVAMNGACIIHDYELALVGATTESVARYIGDGRFGLWKETGELNDIILSASMDGLGMGEAVGRAIGERGLPYRNASLLAAGYRLGIPTTVHVGIGYDIIHEHPNCDGAALGVTSYRDFLRFARVVQDLEGGVVMNFGSAVMAPEVFLKALSMARNIARQEGKSIRHFCTLVCDLYELPDDFTTEPEKGSAAYYFRPWKTMLVRTVADGGQSFYAKGRHSETVPQLWSAIMDVSGE